MSNSTVRSRNTFHLSWCVTVQTHSEKEVCTKHSIWLSLNTATTALSRMLAMFKYAYMYFNFTKFCSLWKPKTYSCFIPTQFVQCDDLVLYSVGSYFKSWAGCQTTWGPLRFSQSLHANASTVPELGHKPFLPNLFQITIYSTFQCCIFWDPKCLFIYLLNLFPYIPIGTYHGNGKSHIHNTSSGNLQLDITNIRLKGVHNNYSNT
jgi:hypothetical protein